jgi:hypothetical protein
LDAFFFLFSPCHSLGLQYQSNFLSYFLDLWSLCWIFCKSICFLIFKKPNLIARVSTTNKLSFF